MNWQFFKLEGMAYALRTAFDFASAIPTVEDLQNEGSELCHISRLKQKNLKF